MIDRNISNNIQEYIDKQQPALSFQDNMGRTALDCALALSLDRAIAVLIERGALGSGADVYTDIDLRESGLDDYVDLEW
jgi:hypothetical protein